MRPAVTFLLLAALVATPEPLWASDDLAISGYVRGYAGVLVTAPHAYSIVQNTLETNLSYTGDTAAFKATPYVYQSPLGPDEFGLRQAYVDLFFGDVDLRVGKQQIIWGKADGVFITDIVSPKDLSEFLLRDFEEIRLGITAIKANYYLGNHTLELVLVPTFTPTRLPAEGSRWRPQLTYPVPVTIDRADEEVSPRLENGEVFAKFSGMTSWADFEFMAGTMWDDDAAMHVTKDFASGSAELQGMTIRPVHHRLNVGGGSFSSDIGGFVLRGEAAYYHGKRYSTAAPAARDALVTKNYVHYLLGIDRSLWGVHLSVQFIQQVILQHGEFMLAPEYSNTVTLLASRDFLRETLRLDLFSYMGINDQDALLRGKISYKVSDGLEALVGADLFFGNEGTFGQFDGNDMVYSKLRYDF